MILELVGRVLELSARVRPGDAGNDRARVGAELCRLERPVAQPPASSR